MCGQRCRCIVRQVHCLGFRLQTRIEIRTIAGGVGFVRWRHPCFTWMLTTFGFIGQRTPPTLTWYVGMLVMSARSWRYPSTAWTCPLQLWLREWIPAFSRYTGMLPAGAGHITSASWASRVFAGPASRTASHSASLILLRVCCHVWQCNLRLACEHRRTRLGVREGADTLPHTVMLSTPQPRSQPDYAFNYAGREVPRPNL